MYTNELRGTIGRQTGDGLKMSNFNQESVSASINWTDNLFSFTTTAIRRSAFATANSR